MVQHDTSRTTIPSTIPVRILKVLLDAVVPQLNKSVRFADLHNTVHRRIEDLVDRDTLQLQLSNIDDAFSPRLVSVSVELITRLEEAIKFAEKLATNRSPVNANASVEGIKLGAAIGIPRKAPEGPQASNGGRGFTDHRSRSNSIRHEISRPAISLPTRPSLPPPLVDGTDLDDHAWRHRIRKNALDAMKRFEGSNFRCLADFWYQEALQLQDSLCNTYRGTTSTEHGYLGRLMQAIETSSEIELAFSTGKLIYTAALASAQICSVAAGLDHATATAELRTLRLPFSAAVVWLPGLASFIAWKKTNENLTIGRIPSDSVALWVKSTAAGSPDPVTWDAVTLSAFQTVALDTQLTKDVLAPFVALLRVLSPDRPAHVQLSEPPAALRQVIELFLDFEPPRATYGPNLFQLRPITARFPQRATPAVRTTTVEDGAYVVNHRVESHETPSATSNWSFRTQYLAFDQ